MIHHIVSCLFLLAGVDAYTSDCRATCPAGHSCRSGRWEACYRFTEPCRMGTVSSYGIGICSPCPIGTYSNFESSACIQCLDGEYAKLGSNICTKCTEGYCPSGIGAPLKCPAGHYCSSTAEAKECPPQTYSLGDSYTQSKCQPCDSLHEGDYCSPTMGVIKCPSGYFCPDSVTQTPCLVGTASNQEGMTSSATCQTCPIGTFANITGSSQCTQCPRGYFCENLASDPIGCPIGTYSDQLYRTLRTDCLQCSKGTLTTETGSVACQPCPIGHYCEDNNQAPLPCPAWTYNPDELAFSISRCHNCSDGTYSGEGEEICQVCPLEYLCVNKQKIQIIETPNLYTANKIDIVIISVIIIVLFFMIIKSILKRSQRIPLGEEIPLLP
jgi:hypothetical protein